MTDPTPSPEEIKRLAGYADLIAKNADNFAGLLEHSMAARRQLRENAATIAAALRSHAAALRERDEARKSLEMLRHAIDDAYAAAKEKPDER